MKVISGYDGFAYNTARDSYVVNEETMPTVVRVFEYVAGGLSLRATAKALVRDGIPSPTGKRFWNNYSLRVMILDDLYRPHTAEEIRELVQEVVMTADVAGRLDSSRPYGVWWSNRERNSARTVSEPDIVGGRRYRKRRKTVPRPRTEWIAVPVDLTGSGLERETVDLARSAIKDNVRPSSAGGRTWEVVGLVFCTFCGRKLHPHTTKAGRSSSRLYYYYQCDNREACGARPRLRAGKLEAEVRQAVQSVLTDPDRLKADLDRMIELERSVVRGDPDREVQHWLQKLSEVDEERRGYLRLAARGRITDKELDEELAALEETRQTTARELTALRNHREHIEALERDRDALLADYAGRAPEALEALTSEERHRLYKMLRLSVAIYPDGNAEIAGAFPESADFLQINNVSCRT